MIHEIILTVSESKRLIARAVHKHPYVKSALKEGTIALCKGTTCSYIAGEFLGHRVEPFTYTSGPWVFFLKISHSSMDLPRFFNIISALTAISESGYFARNFLNALSASM